MKGPPIVGTPEMGTILEHTPEAPCRTPAEAWAINQIEPLANRFIKHRDSGDVAAMHAVGASLIAHLDWLAESNTAASYQVVDDLEHVLADAPAEVIALAKRMRRDGDVQPASLAMLDSAALHSRAAYGDLEAQRQLAIPEHWQATGVPEDASFSLALTWASAAFCRGDAMDRLNLLVVLNRMYEAALKRGDDATAQGLLPSVLQHLIGLTEEPVEWAGRAGGRLAQLLLIATPEQVEVAHLYHRRATALRAAVEAINAPRPNAPANDTAH